MHTEPDVLTEHNELILSTSIERVVTGRDTALKRIEQLIQQLDAISGLTSEIGGGTAQDWAMKAGHRYDSWLTEKADKALPAIIRNIDRSIWRDLMLKSGMMALMDAQARDQWHKNLEEGDLPAISEANILSTFEQLHLNKMDVFERGIINVFKGLSWDYKTNRLAASVRRSSLTIWWRITDGALALTGVGGGINWQTWRECCFCWMANPSLTTGVISPPG